MTRGELLEYTNRLAKLPPIGSTFLVQPKE